MRRPKPATRYEPPKVGDFIARREAFDTGGYVALKTDVTSEKRISACTTFEGATRLAKLCNDARDLATLWRDITITPMFKDGSAEEFARVKIAHAVCKALSISAAHDFGAALIKEPEPC